MKRILAVVLSLIMIVLPITETVEVRADDSSIYFGIGSTTLNISDTETSFDLSYYVRNNTGFTHFNLLNLSWDMYYYYGLTVNSVTPGSLLIENGITNIEIGAENSTVSFMLDAPLTGDGQLFIINVTPITTGKKEILMAPYIDGANGKSAAPDTAYIDVVGTIASSYNIYYDPNGGVGAPDAQTKVPGSNLSLSTIRPTRPGYEFVGWSDDKDATSAKYLPGDTYTSDISTTLYAVWKLGVYNIEFDPNGGTGGPDRDVKQNGVDYIIPGSVPTRSGFTFLGWSTERGGDVQYRVGEAYQVNQDTVFYAVWSEKTLYIEYDLNGGTGSIDKTYGAYNSEIKLTTLTPTREGYDFVGWSTSATGNKEYAAGDSYRVTNLNIKLYAVWTLKQYTVTFDANEGEGAPASMIKIHFTDVTLPVEEPTREGYDFQGWAEEKDAEEVKYAAGTAFAANEEITLYAIWKLKEYTINFNANCSDSSAAPKSITKTHSKEVTLPTDTLNRSKYLFLGWSTDKNAKKATYASGDKYTAEGDATLYAVWKEAVYTIKFDANGGKGGITSLTKEGGKDLVLSFTDKQLPTRDGYFLLGWSSSKKATDPTYVIVYDQVFKTDADTTLYAVWTPNPFKDMTKVKWYTRYIGYLYANGVMTGLKKTSFGYDGEFTRGQLVTILYRIAGQPDVKTKKSPFKDVTKASAYYYNAVLWAKENNIVDGYKTGNFGPNDPIKRQDFMKVLYSYTKEYLKKNVSVKDANAYKEKSDASKVSKYAVEMVNWGYVNGFIGSGSGISPKGTALRNDAATIIARFMVKYDL